MVDKEIEDDATDPAWAGINKIVQRSHSVARDKGWWVAYDEKAMSLFGPEIIGSKLMLIVTEVAEAMEELRGNAGLQETYAVVESQALPYKKVVAALQARGDLRLPKPEGLPSELADIIIRIGDLAGFLGIDLGEAIRQKMQYNKTRAFQHGGKKL